MRIGLYFPSNNTAHATHGVILNVIATANDRCRGIRQISEEKNGTFLHETSLRASLPTDVGFWHLADIPNPLFDVC